MISIKKLYGDELLRLALVLSLLKVDPNDYLERETQQMIAGLHISNGSDWSLEQEARTLIRPRFVHPKSLDNILINYERQLFEELNSLGRYGNSYLEYNERIWNNRAPILHTYLVNNVATDTVAPALAAATVPENAGQDSVSADDNVAQEVKVSDEEEETTNHEERPDAIVTLSADFLHNRTGEDIFAEIASRSFDVNELLVQPSEMQIKKEDENFDVRVKKEEDDEDDLYSDNAIDFMPYFHSKTEMGLGETNSVFQQNLADLQEFGEVDEAKELKHDLEYLDVKQQQENLEQYLMENTPLDSEVYELAPIFEEELVLNVKRERASTSFTASSSGVSDMDVSSEGSDVKLEPDEGHHTGDELTQEDMDLIEVLWKQDVDMGFSLEDPMQPEGPTATKVLGDEIEKELKLAEEKIVKKNEEKAEIEKVKASLLDPEIKEDDPWAGLSYTVDTETGEYVIQGDLPRELVSSEESRFDLLEEALQLVELGDEADTKNEPPEAIEGSSSSSGGSEMLHPAMRHVPHHPLAHYHNQVWTDKKYLAKKAAVAARRSASATGGGPSTAPLLSQWELKVISIMGDGFGEPQTSARVPAFFDHSLMRSMSVEQRWQDLASLLTIPPPPPPDQYQHYHHHHHHQHPHPHSHNITGHSAAGGYAPNYHAPIPPVPEKHPETYGGAAAPLDGAYKVESAQHPQQHDPLYYQNSTAEMAGPTNQDGFLQSILNDEDLQLMDMAMNEGMYTMRMLDGAGAHHAPHHNHSHMMITERDSASDSAVSSMGSERVPSLSDGEWCDGSDSAQEFHSSKFRPYDNTYGRERAPPHQPQKKHHMFGKRCFQEQPAPPIDPVGRPGVVKYECPEQTYHHENLHNMHNAVEFGPRPQLAPPHVTNLHAPALDLNTAHSSHALLQSQIPSPAPPRFAYATPERVRHNHTYSAPLAAADQRPAAVRDKRVRRMTDGSISDGGSSATSSGQHLTRDEKRAKALGIPLEVQDIINLPMDEFNERLSKHDLSEAQLSLIRDIRRRGKNKVAAQNCRKRKLDQITSLADEVRTVRDRKQRTQRDHSSLIAERQRVKERFAALYRHVFQNLRDPEGRPLSSQQYSLQQAADGNVVLVPKMPQHQDHPMNRTSDEEMDRKAKHYEQ